MIWSQSVEFGRTAKDETAFPAQLELRESGLGHRVTSRGTKKKKKLHYSNRLLRKAFALVLSGQAFPCEKMGLSIIASIPTSTIA